MGGGSGSGRGAPVPPATTIGAEAVHRHRHGRLAVAAMSREETRLTRNDSFDTASTSATSGASASTFDGADASIARSPPRRRRHLPPRGLLNLGNTCYANAALQCLFATALPHALLDYKKAAVFRRYASNSKLLEMGTGSADSRDDDDEEDWIGGGLDSGGSGEGKWDGDPLGLPLNDSGRPSSPEVDEADAERRRRRKERRKRRERRQKELEKQTQKELCQWLTREMTALTRNYVAAPPREISRAPSVGSGGFFEGIFGSSSPPTPPLNAVDPGSITRNVHKLCKTLRPYQQEDAHEFLRALLSGLVMDGQNRELSALFDGLLESAVTCQTCRYSSLTRDRYMDLSLDIADRTVKTLPQALRHFTKTELLDDKNMVECGRCKEKRVVSKGLRLATAPTVLVVQLKRFSFDNYGRMMRLNKDVKYPLRLEIGEFMSKANRSTPPAYELVGVLVHSGRTCDSGHYLSYVKSGQRWFKANDAVVTEVSQDIALSQKPYILVYEVAGMKAKHGCDSYHRYHRKEEGRIPSLSTGSAREAASNGGGVRAQSAPPRRDDEVAATPAPTHERGNSDDIQVRSSRVRGGRANQVENRSQCDAISSLFGLLELCGSTSQVVDDDGDCHQEYAEDVSPKSTSPQSPATSKKMKHESSASSRHTARGSEYKEMIGLPRSRTRSLDAEQQDEREAPPSPTALSEEIPSALRLKRSSSTGAAGSLERNAARAYSKNGGRDRRSSTCCADRDVVSSAATDIVVGSKGEHHRRAEALSRIVHRSASKQASGGSGTEHSVTEASRSSPTGMTVSKVPRSNHQQSGSRGRKSGNRSKSKSRRIGGALPPLPIGKGSQ